MSLRLVLGVLDNLSVPNSDMLIHCTLPELRLYILEAQYIRRP